MKKKIIFLGGEDVSARIEISKKLIKFGYSIEIIGTQNEKIFAENNIPYKKYSFNREFNIISDIKTIFELRNILKKQNNKTIIHAFDTKPTMFLPLSAFGLNDIKIVRTITGMGRIFVENNIKNNIFKIIYNIIQKIINIRVDFTIFQNDEDYNYYRKNNLVNKHNSVIIKSSGLDLKKFQIIKNINSLNEIKKELKLKNNKTFILISRIVKQKGILYYLKSAKLCFENGYNYNFLLVGQLDSDNSITLEEIDLYSKYVKYLGRREDVKELLHVSDIFVLPTYYREGIPRVLLEASALGLPSITTNMPGCKDVIIDKYNGRLVNIKDSQDLYEKMIDLAESKKIKEYSKNAIKKIKEFDLDIIVNSYNRIYNKS